MLGHRGFIDRIKNTTPEFIDTKQRGKAPKALDRAPTATERADVAKGLRMFLGRKKAKRRT